MSASQNLARLREQTMGSQQEEEAVTVNTRALIDKVLARYSGEWTTLRELIQNAADAQARKVTIRFETTPSPTIPLPSTHDPSEHLKHTLLHHTLKTMIVSNDGELFKETDWQRLKRIAEGNPDETKIGAFGVGFYSVFADCESPFVSSGKESVAFYWKKDSLFTRRGKLPDGQAAAGTTFLLDYRSQTTPIPQLLSLCQFLATSLTFVGLECVELYLDDWKVMTLAKKMAPGAKVKIPSDVNPKTQNGIMKIVDVEYQNAQIDAVWMNVVGWDRRSQASSASSVAAQPTDASGLSLRGFFGRFTNPSTNSVARKVQREEETLQQSILEDLTGISRATVFLRLSTVNVQTFVSKQLSQELERATKKPPPKTTRIAILTSSHDETEASSSTVSGISSKRAADIFASVLPVKNGKIFIGFPTAQTTGLLAHISAPSVIPTVERESIDLNARYVRDWNIEMLRVAGIACRIAYTGEMVELKAKLERTASANGRKKVTREDVTAVLPSAIHTYKQYNYSESTPSSKVGGYIEEAFWTCNSKASIDVLSTRGVLPSQQVRVATEDLSFVEGIPVVPDELMDKANEFLTKLREFGLLSDITTGDIKKELEAQALTEKQVVELIKWACKKVSQQDMDASGVKILFDGTVASVSEEFIATSPSPVLQLGQIQTFINSARIPAEMPTPSQTVPFRLTKGLTPSQLQSIGWEELQIVPWLRWIIESNSQGFGSGQSLTTTPSVASQVLPVVSKSWDGLSQSSKQTVQELLVPRTVIPTRLGMRKPAQAYFGSVKLFDDLPTIHGLQGVKEKFLSSLGVRKTVELNVVFDRLMAKSSATPTAAEEGKWSHVDLIRYLLSVKDDIPPEEIKRLRQTPICPAETQSADQTSKTKLHRLADLYQPSDALRKLGLPLLQWPGTYRETSPEGRFLASLGLNPHPDVPVLVSILARAPTNSALQRDTLAYWLAHAYPHNYARYPTASIDRAFLPVLPFPGEADNMIAKPAQCYADPRAAVLKFRTLRADLAPHAAIFGVAGDPPIELCAERACRFPPATEAAAQALFGYFAGRMGEIPVNGSVAEKLGNATIVPVFGERGGGEKASSTVRFIAPRSCFLGTSTTYAAIFDFVDFGADANQFLLRVGCKHEPSAAELACMLVAQPARLLETLGAERYLQLLRKLADAQNVEALRRNKALWASLKGARCLIGEKLVRTTSGGDEKVDAEDDDALVKEISLARAAELVLVDDIVTYRLFTVQLRAAPQEEALEDLYAALECPLLSQLVQDDQRMGAVLRDQASAENLRRLLTERCRLFLHDHAAEAIRHDASWLEGCLAVKAVEFLQVTRTLRGYGVRSVEKRTAALHQATKRDATLYVTAQVDLFQVSRAVVGLLLKRPRQQDFLALETILESDLRRLKVKGYNVDRILRAKAAESRIAEGEKARRVEEERLRVANEAEAEGAAPPPYRAAEGQRALEAGPSAGSEGGKRASQSTPTKDLAMPGAFADSPEQQQQQLTLPPSAATRRKPTTGLFNTLTKAFSTARPPQSAQSLPNLLGSGQGTTQQIQEIPGTERVSSPQDLQANLSAAIAASRAHNSPALFSPPATKELKESGESYCDATPGQDLSFVAELAGGIRVYLSRSASTQPGGEQFLATHNPALTMFATLLTLLATEVFGLETRVLNIFHDEVGASIAFNSAGSIFCNLRYFLQLHYAELVGGNGAGNAQMEALAYWFVTLAHELAHNLVSEHSARHSFYTESFVAGYFGRVVGVVARGWGGRVVER